MEKASGGSFARATRKTDEDEGRRRAMTLNRYIRSVTVVSACDAISVGDHGHCRTRYVVRVRYGEIATCKRRPESLRCELLPTRDES
jgi:hypothetical protein